MVSRQRTMNAIVASYWLTELNLGILGPIRELKWLHTELEWLYLRVVSLFMQDNDQNGCPLGSICLLRPVIMTEVVLAFRLHISLHKDPNGQKNCLHYQYHESNFGVWGYYLFWIPKCPN